MTPLQELEKEFVSIATGYSGKWTCALTDLTGVEGVNAKLRRLGLPQTSLFLRLGDRSAGMDARKMSVSTAGEMARLLELIATQQAASPAGCDDMLRIMRRMRERAELSHL